MKIQGLVSAIVTPFSADGAEIDEQALRDLVDRTIEAGIDGIIPCGGTGEFIALSPQERQRVVEICVEQAQKRVPIVAQTGGLSTREALAYTRHATDVGADGLMVAPPFYEALDETKAYEYFGEVAQSSPLPVMIYNYPNGTGLAMTAEFMKRLADDFETVSMIKDSSADAALLSQFATEYKDSIDTFCGEDVLVPAGMTLGITGFVTGCFNFMTPVHVQMLKAARAGDYQRTAELWREILPLIVTLATNPYTSAVKEACAIIGHNVGPVREPQASISAAGRKKLETQIQALDPSYFA